MAQHSRITDVHIAAWHRNLLVATAIITVLLISMGGVLCVTQSIRNCPDWPGCFGKVIPPAQTGPILEYAHRLLAALSGLLILSTVVAGLTRSPRLSWISIPPMVAVVFLLLVSYFGALVVLRGLSPGWAAVDVGSALLVVALMVTTALIAHTRNKTPALAERFSLCNPFARLVLVMTAVVYITYLSGVLVAGKNSITGCLGWPIYSLRLLQMDAHIVGSALRWILSIAGIVMVIAVLLEAWRKRQERPAVFSLARWLGIAGMLEGLIQILLLLFGLPVALLVIYTVVAAVFWALVVALLVRTGLEGSVS